MNHNQPANVAGEVAIVGRPNVGKSALFNRLAGRNIAIVHDQPGITRDRLAAPCVKGRRPFRVWDTGGIGGAGEKELRAQVRTSAEAAMHESDLILFVVDAQDGLTPVDEELAKLLRRSRKPVLLVVNKIDHPNHEAMDSDFAQIGFTKTVSISAAHGRGISWLLDTIDSLLPTPSVISDSPVSQEPAEGGLAVALPLPLAIVGRPNAGKSSLINSIVRDARTIVSELPGTTRDAVDIKYRRNDQEYLLIDTAGIRARSKHSSSVEVFSVMRAERTIRRADLCILVVDLASGVTGQDKKIAGLIQKAEKPCLIVLNKWDLVKPKKGARAVAETVNRQAREQLFFLQYAPVLMTSALTGENVSQLFRLIDDIREAGKQRIGTGVLNRHLRKAFEENPPPSVGNRRLKLLYAAQAGDEKETGLEAIKFVLFVNQPKLLTETYGRYLEARIRSIAPYTGLPVLLSCRARTQNRKS